MSIDYKNNKFRFRVAKNGTVYTQHYISTKKLSEKDIQEKKWPRDVIQAHKDFEVSITRNEIGKKEGMLFNNLAQLVLDEHVRPNLRPNTESYYITSYNTHILECFGGIPLNRIDSIDIQKFINNKSKTLKPSTVRQLYAVLSSTFSKAVDWKFIKENPCKNITLPKIDNKNYTELLTVDEISKLMEAIENEPEMYKVIFSIALYCGLRQGEILGLTIPDIDLDNNYINVNKQYVSHYKNGKVYHEIASTKTANSIRKVYMPVAVSNALEQYIDNLKVLNINLDKQYLFINPKTQAIYDHNAIYRRFKKMAKRIGLNNITFHDLRHLQATMMINSGVNIVVVAKRLGDTIETVSNTYLHSIEKVEKESVNQLQNFITNKIRTN
jgi:integrase